MSQQTERARRPEEILAALNKSFQVFLEEAESYPRELAQSKPSSKAFSATEILYHMLDVERLWQTRIRGLIDGTIIHFQQMNPDALAIERRYNEKEYDRGLTDLRQSRTETHAIIRSLKPRELELTGIHSKYGEMNVVRMLEILEEHDHTHAAQLRRTLSQVGHTKATTTQ
ncbi:MAG TPA: DinB family protein [Candidatus Kapabacteria bacterium]|jgi:uncharacterized damage-inducible protein DinB